MPYYSSAMQYYRAIERRDRQIAHNLAELTRLETELAAQKALLPHQRNKSTAAHRTLIAGLERDLAKERLERKHWEIVEAKLRKPAEEARERAREAQDAIDRAKRDEREAKELQERLRVRAAEMRAEFAVEDARAAVEARQYGWDFMQYADGMDVLCRAEDELKQLRARAAKKKKEIEEKEYLPRYIAHCACMDRMLFADVGPVVGFPVLEVMNC